jgi:hypothetical protein
MPNLPYPLLRLARSAVEPNAPKPRLAFWRDGVLYGEA